MPTSEDLTRPLAALERHFARLRVFRAARASYDPLSTRGARLHGGRWNPPGLATLYASLEPLTVRAELLRVSERQGEREGTAYPLKLVELTVEADLLDLEQPGVLAGLGVEEPLSLLTPLAGTRAIGQAAAALGIGALRVPSVATRAANAVLFTENLRQQPIVEALTPLASPEDWPAS